MRESLYRRKERVIIATRVLHTFLAPAGSRGFPEMFLKVRKENSDPTQSAKVFTSGEKDSGNRKALERPPKETDNFERDIDPGEPNSKGRHTCVKIAQRSLLG